MGQPGRLGAGYVLCLRGSTIERYIPCFSAIPPLPPPTRPAFTLSNKIEHTPQFSSPGCRWMYLSQLPYGGQRILSSGLYVQPNGSCTGAARTRTSRLRPIWRARAVVEDQLHHFFLGKGGGTKDTVPTRGRANRVLWDPLLTAYRFFSMFLVWQGTVSSQKIGLPR